MTTYVVLLLLALLWAAVLVPPLVKNRGGRRQGPRDPFMALSSTLPPLGERGSVRGNVVPLRGQAPGAPQQGSSQALFAPATNESEARQRRRNVLIGLAGAALVTLLLAVGLGGFFIALNLLVDLALLGFVVVLVRHQKLTQDRRNKIRPIRPVQPGYNAQPQHIQYQQHSAH